ncbi:hypothetical protein K435DRAFT_880196 [Dendrothele bispora CBS 962.96]|uniref:Methyltransferase domain-containing protein n=1 Tax=Dendrothele bispora (strain CBS 962.96) TaxID=1314807 RepID=A0A4S8KJT7_DENBC|nr:hypothetical protein K435DRAFT_880196 [Dendrothele bispora CBS 962.96]
MSKHPAYDKFLDYVNVNKNAVFLDMGCCFGANVRKAIADGYLAERIIASDIHQEFWVLGHKLFKSGPKTTLPTFVQGDILDPSFISGPQQHTATDPISSVDLKILTNLSTHQTKVAQQLAALLTQTSGSTIFGSHESRPEKGFRTEAPPSSASSPGNGYLGNHMFCHSPSS